MELKDLQTLSMNGVQDAREGKISQESRSGQVTKEACRPSRHSPEGAMGFQMTHQISALAAVWTKWARLDSKTSWDCGSHQEGLMVTERAARSGSGERPAGLRVAPSDRLGGKLCVAGVEM